MMRKRYFSSFPTEPFQLRRDSLQARGLVAWWPGNSGRDYKSTNNLSFNGNAKVASSLNGPAFDFDGLNTSYCSFTGLSDLSGDALSLSFWLRGRNYDSAGYMVIGTNTGGSYYWQIENNTSVWIQARSRPISAIDFNDGQWRHLVMVSAAGDGAWLYVNGTLAAGQSGVSGVGSLPTGDKEFNIGRWVGGALWDMDGQISDMRFYNRILSPSEIWQLYAPQTRWELYEPIIPAWSVGWAAAPVATGNPWYAYAQQ